MVYSERCLVSMWSEDSLKRFPLGGTGMDLGRNKRVLLAKGGLDSHSRGIKVIAQALREAGMEVVYLGLHRSPEEIVEAAIQEDVDVIGISSMGGVHGWVFPQVLKLLKDKGVVIPIVGGGIISKDDCPTLKESGVVEIFGPGTTLSEIVTFISKL